MELGAQVPRPMWKGVAHTEPKRRLQIQEVLPIVRGCLAVVEVMLTHRASRRLLVAAKVNIEVTQQHHLVNKGHDLQAAKHEQMKSILDESVRHIYGCISHRQYHMMANNHPKMS
jgi:hypothetical protein